MAGAQHRPGHGAAAVDRPRLRVAGRHSQQRDLRHRGDTRHAFGWECKLSGQRAVLHARSGRRQLVFPGGDRRLQPGFRDRRSRRRNGQQRRQRQRHPPGAPGSAGTEPGPHARHRGPEHDPDLGRAQRRQRAGAARLAGACADVQRQRARRRRPASGAAVPCGRPGRWRDALQHGQLHSAPGCQRQLPLLRGVRCHQHGARARRRGQQRGIHRGRGGARAAAQPQGDGRHRPGATAAGARDRGVVDRAQHPAHTGYRKLVGAGLSIIR